jgi:hypothetical protein
MKKYVLMFLMAFSAAAWADDKPDQRNVYDVYREFLKPSAYASVDQQVTILIKRHMGNLLYPVDMSSFVGPEQDGKFRDLIMALQKQMGAPVTGVLTFDQFSLLEEAARDIDERPVMVPNKKNVFVDSASISASGTMDGFRHSLNMARIFCWKPSNTCEVTIASLSLNEIGPSLFLDVTDTYEIKTWTLDRVVTMEERPCATITMTVNLKTETVNIVWTPRTPGCFGSGPNIETLVETLVDGSDVAWKLHQERMSKARALVYEPAKKLMPW